MASHQRYSSAAERFDSALAVKALTELPPGASCLTQQHLQGSYGSTSWLIVRPEGNILVSLQTLVDPITPDLEHSAGFALCTAATSLLPCQTLWLP